MSVRTQGTTLFTAILILVANDGRCAALAAYGFDRGIAQRTDQNLLPAAAGSSAVAADQCESASLCISFRSRCGEGIASSGDGSAG